MKELKYVCKQDVINKGLCKQGGYIYKKSVLEIWYSKGWLELENSAYGSDDRLYYGHKLAFDHYLVNRDKIHSVQNFYGRIDVSTKIICDSVADAEIRLSRAIRAVPKEFWGIVRLICIEDKEPVVPKGCSERQRAYYNYLARVDLCRGLDRVISVYT